MGRKKGKGGRGHSKSAGGIAEQLELLRKYEENWRRGNYRGCVTISTRLVVSSPEKANFYVQRAKAYLELGLLSEVITDTEKAMELAPRTARAYMLQGCAWFDMIEIAQRHSSGRDTKVRAFTHLRNAIHNLNKAKDIDPDVVKIDKFKRYEEMCDRMRRLMAEGSSRGGGASSNSSSGSRSTVRSAIQCHSDHSIPERRARRARGTDSGARGSRYRGANGNVQLNDDGYGGSQNSSLSGGITIKEADAVRYKAELLVLMTSLRKRFFNESTSIVDIVRDVHTINEYGTALLQAEGKLAYEAQQRNWFADRPAWVHGVRCAKSMQQLHVSLRVLRRSIKNDAFECDRPAVEAQICTVVDELLAHGDTGMSMSSGECKRLCLRLLTIGIADYQQSIRLRMSRGNLLLQLGHHRRAIGDVDRALEINDTTGKAGADLNNEEALRIRAEAVAQLERAGETVSAEMRLIKSIGASSAKASAANTLADLEMGRVEVPDNPSVAENIFAAEQSKDTLVPKQKLEELSSVSSEFVNQIMEDATGVGPPPAKAKNKSRRRNRRGKKAKSEVSATASSISAELREVAELAAFWEQLSYNERRRVLRVPLSELKKVVVDVHPRLRQSLIEANLSNLEAYRSPSPLDQSASMRALSSTNNQDEERTSTMCDDPVWLGVYRGLQEASNVISNVMAEYGSSREVLEFDHALFRQPSGGIRRNIGGARKMREGMPSDEIERLALSMQHRRPQGLCSKSVTLGWQEEEGTVGQGNAPSRGLGATLSSQAINTLLLEDVYYVHLENDTSTNQDSQGSDYEDERGLPGALSRANGIFVSAVCARLCHARFGRRVTRIGRAALKCECGSRGPSCQILGPESIWTPYVHWATDNDIPPSALDAATIDTETAGEHNSENNASHSRNRRGRQGSKVLVIDDNSEPSEPIVVKASNISKKTAVHDTPNSEEEKSLLNDSLDGIVGESEADRLLGASVDEDRSDSFLENENRGGWDHICVSVRQESSLKSESDLKQSVRESGTESKPASSSSLSAPSKCKINSTTQRSFISHVFQQAQYLPALQSALKEADDDEELQNSFVTAGTDKENFSAQVSRLDQVQQVLRQIQVVVQALERARRIQSGVVADRSDAQSAKDEISHFVKSSERFLGALNRIDDRVNQEHTETNVPLTTGCLASLLGDEINHAMRISDAFSERRKLLQSSVASTSSQIQENLPNLMEAVASVEQSDQDVRIAADTTQSAAAGESISPERSQFGTRIAEVDTKIVEQFSSVLKRMAEEVLIASAISTNSSGINDSDSSNDDERRARSAAMVDVCVEAGVPKHELQTIQWKQERFSTLLQDEMARILNTRDMIATSIPKNRGAVVLSRLHADAAAVVASASRLHSVSPSSAKILMQRAQIEEENASKMERAKQLVKSLVTQVYRAKVQNSTNSDDSRNSTWRSRQNRNTSSGRSFDSDSTTDVPLEMATAEVAQLLHRARCQHAEGQVVEKWRRGELTKRIHLRYQMYYSALARAVIANMKTLRQERERDAVADLLMHEEEQAKKRTAAGEAKRARQAEKARLKAQAREKQREAEREHEKQLCLLRQHVEDEERKKREGKEKEALREKAKLTEQAALQHFNSRVEEVLAVLGGEQNFRRNDVKAALKMHDLDAEAAISWLVERIDPGESRDSEKVAKKRASENTVTPSLADWTVVEPVSRGTGASHQGKQRPSELTSSAGGNAASRSSVVRAERPSRMRKHGTSSDSRSERRSEQWNPEAGGSSHGEGGKRDRQTKKNQQQERQEPPLIKSLKHGQCTAVAVEDGGSANRQLRRSIEYTATAVGSNKILCESRTDETTPHDHASKRGWETTRGESGTGGRESIQSDIRTVSKAKMASLASASTSPSVAGTVESKESAINCTDEVANEPISPAVSPKSPTLSEDDSEVFHFGTEEPLSPTLSPGESSATEEDSQTEIEDQSSENQTEVVHSAATYMATQPAFIRGVQQQLASVPHPPVQPQQYRPACIWFQRGMCRYGPGCRDRHISNQQYMNEQAFVALHAGYINAGAQGPPIPHRMQTPPQMIMPGFAPHAYIVQPPATGQLLPPTRGRGRVSSIDLRDPPVAHNINQTTATESTKQRLTPNTRHESIPK